MIEREDADDHDEVEHRQDQEESKGPGGGGPEGNEVSHAGAVNGKLSDRGRGSLARLLQGG